MKPIILNLDLIQDTHDFIEMMQGYDYNLECNIYEDGSKIDLNGYSARVEMVLGNKSFIVQTLDIVISDNKISIVLDKDFTNHSGEGGLQVVISKNDRTHGSWFIRCRIKQNALGKSDDTKSKEDITVSLMEKITEALETKKDLDISINNGNVAKIRSDLDEIIDVEIPKINSSLETKANKTATESALATKREKTTLLTMADMGQDVKTAMTGGSVAVVGKDAVLETNIVDKQVTKRKTSFYNKSLNLENKDLQISGKGILSNSGDIYDNSNLVATVEYIPINCTYLSFQKFNSDGVSIGSNENISIAFYQNDKTFISYTDLVVNKYIAVPQNTTFIRYQIMSNVSGFDFNLLPTQDLENIYIEQYTFEETEKINKTINSLKDGSFLTDGIIKPSKTSFFEIYSNLFNEDTQVVGAISKDNGTLMDSFDQWRATDWIEVKAGTVIYFSNDGESYTTHLGALYNSSKQYLSPINNLTSVNISENGYMRVSQNGGFPSKYQIEISQVTEYKKYGSPKEFISNDYIDINLPTNYENKNFLLLGDSITALGNNNYGWEYHFRKIVNPNKVVNIAVNGCTWKDYSDTSAYDGNPTPENHLNVIGNQVQKVINQKASGNADYSTFDIIIIACGTNDTYTPATDTISDVEKQFINSYYPTFDVVPLSSVDRTTFAGAMRYAYDKLYELYPNAIFFVTTPLQEVYENFESIKGKGELIDYIADRLSINTINARRCGILNIYESPVGDIDYDNPTGSESNRKRDLSDGIHTGVGGAKKLGECIARDIINYFNF